MDYSTLIIAGQPMAIGVIASVITEFTKELTWFPQEKRGLYCQLLTGVLCATFAGGMAAINGEPITVQTVVTSLVGYLSALGFFNQFLQK